MDPRHPEQAVTRLKELIEQYDRVEKGMAKATVASELGQLEREGGLVVQEICLVAPRLHEAMMQASRQRRYELSHPITAEMLKPATQEVIKQYVEDTVAEIKPKKRGRKKKAE